MFFGNTTHETRSVFFSGWQKHKENQPLTPLEGQLVEVIIAHPEYHRLLDQAINSKDPTVLPASGENPFLHMGLHLAIRDQVAMNKPDGIAACYHSLLQKHGDPLYVEHLMMEPLAICLWESQRNNQLPDEIRYLNACKELL